MEEEERFSRLASLLLAGLPLATSRPAPCTLRPWANEETGAEPEFCRGPCVDFSR